MEEQTKDLRDYLWTLRRRKIEVLAISAVLFLGVAAVAMMWPPTYRSTATILIEEQEIPPDLVRSTISSYADQRIHVISQYVMTRANLMQIIEKYQLYPGFRRTHTNEESLERLRKDIKLDLLKADVIDQRSGSRTTATIAFTLSVSGETAAGAQKVANELVSLYLDQNIRNRQQKTAETSSFLAEEVARLSEHITDVEKKLASFKTKNMGRLPELMQLNMQLRDRAENELREVDRQLLMLEDRKFYLEGQLAQIKPNIPALAVSGERVANAGDRLAALQAQYASLVGVYSSEHPDVVKMRREIEALRKDGGSASDPSGQPASKSVDALRTDLAAVRQKYSDDHPDVVKLKKAIAAHEAQQPSSSDAKAPSAKPGKPESPDNPAYIALQAQLESTINEIKSLRAKQAELRSKMASYEVRLEQTPQVEREYVDLTRDREASVARFREIKAKQMEAQISQELEKDRKGERFSLIDPPQVPEQPSSPNRPAILLLGFLLSSFGSLASLAMFDAMDRSVRNSKSLADLVQAPLLAVIPYMDTRAERMHRWKVRTTIAASSLAVLIAGLIVVHMFWTPLDVLWYRGLRKLDTYAPGIVGSVDVPSSSAGIRWSA